MPKRASGKPKPRRVLEADFAIGERIRSRRNQIKMSQTELGDALQISFQQIQKYEKGTNRLSSGRLLHVAEILRCGVADLIGGDDKLKLKSTPFSRYAASKEGVQVITAMQKISSPAVRRHVISLIKSLSG